LGGGPHREEQERREEDPFHRFTTLVEGGALRIIMGACLNRVLTERNCLAASSAPRPQNVGLVCGALTRRVRHCLKCGREVSGKNPTGEGWPSSAQAAVAQKKRSQTQQRHEAAKRAWRNSLGSLSCLSGRGHEIQVALAGLQQIRVGMAHRQGLQRTKAGLSGNQFLICGARCFSISACERSLWALCVSPS
jgi:hypothetical protein